MLLSSIYPSKQEAEEGAFSVGTVVFTSTIVGSTHSHLQIVHQSIISYPYRAVDKVLLLATCKFTL